MKIGIDVSMVGNEMAGIGYYAYNLARTLPETDKSNDYTLFTHDLELTQRYFPENYKIVEIKAVRPNTFWILKVISYLNHKKYDKFISPSNFAFGILYKNTIQIVHDLAPIFYPYFFTFRARFMYRLQLKLLIQKKRLIAANSNTTKNDVLAFSKNKAKVFNIGIGLNEWVYEEVNSKKRDLIRKKYNLAKNFVFSLSTIEPRKNHINTIKAFALFLKENPDYEYIIGGKKGWFYDEIFTTVKDLNLESKVRFLGYIPEEDMAPIFDMADAFLYVSFWEGVGLPPVEAYSRRTPSVVSDTRIFRETMEKGALFAKPDDIFDIQLKINTAVKMKRNLVLDESFLASFSWDLVSKRLTFLYNK